MSGQRGHWPSEHVVIVDDALTPGRCAELVALAQRHRFEPAPIAQVVIAPEVRNNTRVMFDDVELAASLWPAVRDVFPDVLGTSPIGLNERIRFYQYTPGQSFNWHYDGIVPLPRRITRFTVLFYLTDGFEGGQTAFQHAPGLPPYYPVDAKLGRMCAFRHDQPIRHAGLAVTGGATKIVLRTDVFYRRPGS